MAQTISIICATLLLLTSFGCGSGSNSTLGQNQGTGSGSGTPGTGSGSGPIAVYPSNVAVLYRGNQTFHAVVIPPGLQFGEGDPIDATWTIQEGQAGGTITSTGMLTFGMYTAIYTAPAASGTYHVIATSKADPTKSGSTTVRVIQSGPGFASTASLLTDRFGFTATLLLDGKVLVAAGGINASGGTDVIGDAELYDPAEGTFHRSSSTASPRIFHSATLLPNGKVLLVGGLGLSGTNAITLKTADIYDPNLDSFTATGEMTSARQGHTITLLKNGKVLVAGGKSDAFLATAEIYDPSTGQFLPTGNMITARTGHTATLLPDGRVLIAGGEGSSGALASVELFDPTAQSFTSAGAMSAPRDLHAATLLGNGKVLIAGGGATDAGSSSLPLDNADIYDPSSGTFTVVAGMYAVASHTATLLDSGRVLLAGGDGFFPGCPVGPLTFDECLGKLPVAQIYDPAPNSFAQISSMANPRSGHKAVLLRDGRVLIVGGSFSNSVEVFQE
jgi:hypothetical protein